MINDGWEEEDYEEMARQQEERDRNDLIRTARQIIQYKGPILPTEMRLHTFKLLDYDNLVEIYQDFMNYYDRTGTEDRHYIDILEESMKPKHLKFSLESYGWIRPEQLMVHVGKNEIIPKLISLDMCISYGRIKNDHFQFFDYDFSEARNPKHLSIVGAYLFCCNVYTANLISLRLLEIPNQDGRYNRHDIGYYMFFNPSCIDSILRATPKLETLYLDHISMNMPTDYVISNELKAISLGDEHSDTRVCCDLITNHLNSLRRVRLTLPAQGIFDLT